MIDNPTVRTPAFTTVSGIVTTSTGWKNVKTFTQPTLVTAFHYRRSAGASAQCSQVGLYSGAGTQIGLDTLTSASADKGATVNLIFAAGWSLQLYCSTAEAASAFAVDFVEEPA